jgi:hypothetical protein
MTIGMGTHSKRRQLENSRRNLGTDGAFASAPKAASARMPQSTRSRPQCYGRDILRTSHRVPVECPERHIHMQQFFSAPTVHGMDRGRGFQRLLGMRPACVRRSCGNRLVLALDGWCDYQSTAWRGKKPAQIPRIGQKRERSGVCSPKPKEFQSASWSMARTETTLSWLSRQSRAFRSDVRRPKPTRDSP